MNLVLAIRRRLLLGHIPIASTPILSTFRPDLHHFYHNSAAMSSPAKRKAESTQTTPKPKKPKITIPEYHLTPSRRDESGEIVWPAPKEQIERAREIIREW
jgi:hypothetical protein